MNVKHKFITAPFHDMCSNNNNGNLYKPESFADIYCIILMHSSKKKTANQQYYAISILCNSFYSFSHIDVYHYKHLLVFS